VAGHEVHEGAHVVALRVAEHLLGGPRVGARSAAGVALRGEHLRHAHVRFGRRPIELRGAAEVREGALAIALCLVELRAVEVAARVGRPTSDEVIQLRQRGLVVATLPEELRAHDVRLEVGGIRSDERGPRGERGVGVTGGEGPVRADVQQIGPRLVAPLHAPGDRGLGAGEAFVDIGLLELDVLVVQHPPEPIQIGGEAPRPFERQDLARRLIARHGFDRSLPSRSHGTRGHRACQCLRPEAQAARRAR
jgi:hypothetical protein